MKGMLIMDKRYSEIVIITNRFGSAALLNRSKLDDILKMCENETDKLMFCLKNTGKMLRLKDGEVINADMLYNRIYSRADAYLKSLGA